MGRHDRRLAKGSMATLTRTDDVRQEVWTGQYS